MTDKEIAAFCLRCTKDSLDCPLAAGDYDRAVEMSCCRNQKRIVIEPECAENAKKEGAEKSVILAVQGKRPGKRQAQTEGIQRGPQGRAAG